MTDAKPQVIHLDTSKPDDDLALDQIIAANGGPPPAFVSLNKDLSEFTLVISGKGGGATCRMGDDGLDYLIVVLTAARGHKAKLLKLRAE